MNSTLESLGVFLADFQLLAATLLAVVVVAQMAMRQPARRMAVTKSTLAALAALTALCALPGWSLIHLLAADATPVPAATFASAPAAQPMVVEIKDNIARFPVARAKAPVGSVTPVSNQWASISWPAALFALYWGGSAAVVAWLVIGSVSAGRVRRSAASAPDELVEFLRRIVGGARSPRLLVSDQVETAAAMGVWRAQIILGKDLVDSGTRSNDSLAAVLAHEWAHIRNGDLWTLALSRLLLVLLWAQPLYWLFRKQMRLDQETLADAAAVAVSGRVDYAEQLLGWAQWAAPRRQASRLAGAVGLWEGPSQLKRRVAALLDDKFALFRECTRRWRVGSACLLLAAASGLSLVTLERAESAPDAAGTTQATVAAPAQPEEAPAAVVAAPADGGVLAPTPRQAEPNVVAGVCVSESGAPLAGVKVQVFGYEQNEPAHVNLKVIAEKVTGADGAFRFERVVDVAREYPNGLPDDLNFPQPPIKVLSVVARAAGRAGSREDSLASWAARRGMAPRFVLSPAARLHGQVTGPDGKPVAGAEVMAGLGGSPDGTMNTARTDAEGRYSIEDLAAFDGAKAREKYEAYQQRQLAAPKRDGDSADAETFSLWPAPQMMLLVKHPDFATKRVAVDNIPGEKNAQLHPAAAIEGRVLFNKGVEGSVSPAAQATVMLVRDMPERESDDPVSMFAFQTEQTATDAKGRFRFGSLPTGKYHLMARTEGAASPVVQGVAATGGSVTKAPDIVMTQGGVVRMTLVDQESSKTMDLAEGAKIYVNPYPRPELPAGLSPAASNVVTLSAGAKGEMRLPPGEYVILASIPGDENKPYWQSANFASYQQAPGVRIDEGAVVDVAIPMKRIRVNELPTATLAIAGPPTDEATDEKTLETTNSFVPATPPAEGLEADTAEPSAAAKPNPEKFVRIVVGPDGAITFEGERTTWDGLPALLAKVADREKTVLEIAIASDEMSVREANNAQGLGFILSDQFKFLYGSYVGTHPLGSKGGVKPAP